MVRRIALATACLLALVSAASAADVVKMNLNAIYPASNFHSRGAEEFAKRVDEYTGGTVKIAVHPGGSLGFKGPELLKAVKDGTLPMSDILMGVVAGSEEIFGLSSLPRMVKSYEEARKYYEIARPAYDKAAEKWNQKILYACPWPPSGLFTKKPVKSVADIDGLKTRTYDKNGADFLNGAGGSPVSLPWGEVYSSLQTGMIDSVLTSAVSGKDGKFWEVLSHFTKIDFAYPLNMVTINLDYWKALTDEQKAALEKAASEMEAVQWERSNTSNEEALKVLAENDIEISQADAALDEALDKVAAEIVEEFAQGAGEDVKSTLEAFQK